MVGQNIGKYRVIDRIGRGGMGTVYRAVDETLHRDVAIKVLNAELNDPGVARRFKAEAVTVARLNHPGIATIFELFQHEGQWLMVMEFLRGETLDALITRKGPLDPPEAARLCMQALNALSHAHSLGVVHRDLKPANVMLTENGNIKIMDFGIARVSGTEHLTNAGFLMGTPAYMAPEQVTGGEVDARADLYAMGVVFFYLLSARLPFKGDTPFEVVQSRLRDQPTPIATLRDGLPAWITRIMDIALERDVPKRYQSAPLFHEALRRGLANLPLDTPEQSAIPPELIATALPNTMPAVGPGMMTPASTARGDVPIAPTPLATAAGTAGSTSAAPTVVPTLSAAAIPAAAAAPTTLATSDAPTRAALDPVRDAGPGPARAPSVSSSTSSSNRIALIVAGIAALLVIAAGATWWWRARQAAATAVVNQAATEPTPATTPAAPPPAPVEGSATPPPATPPTPGAAPAAPAAGATQPGTNPATPAVPAAPGTTLDPSAGTAAGGPGTAAAGRGRGRGRGLVNDPLLALEDIRYEQITGKRAEELEVTLNFASGRITVVAKRGGATLSDIAYADLVAATYARGKDPKWDTSVPAPPTDVDFPGSLFRQARHWLVLQTRTTFVVLRLGDDWRRVVETVTERTGLRVEQVGG